MEIENKVFKSTEQSLLHDEKPSLQLRILAETVWAQEGFFEELLKQQSTEQSPLHHPEGSVWEHTMLVVDEAAKLKKHSTDARSFMWAALLHDMGKPATTKIRKGRITSYDHDKLGAKMAQEFLAAMTSNMRFARKTAMLVRYHMQLLYVEKGLPFADILGMKSNTDIMDIALLGYCDRMGRLGACPDVVGREVADFLQKLAPDRLGDITR